MAALNARIQTLLRRPDDEPRLLWLPALGAIVLVLLLAAAFGLYSLLQNAGELDASLRAAEEASRRQQEKRLLHTVASGRELLDYLRSRTSSLLEDTLREQVDQAYRLADTLHREESGHRPPAEVQRLIIEALRPLRFFGGRGYIFIDDLDGTSVLMPPASEREGHSLIGLLDDRGRDPMRLLIEAASQPAGAGFTRYRWYMPDEPTRMADKVAYVRRFEPYHWLIGTGEYIGSVAEDVQRDALAQLRGVHFDREAHLAVFRSDGALLLVPTAREYEGRDVGAITDAGERAMVERLLAVGQAGGGFVSHAGPRPGGGPAAAKLSYVSAPDTWGWMLSAALYVDDARAALERQRAALSTRAGERLRTTGLILLAGVLGAVALAALYGRWVGGRLRAYRSDLENRNAELREHARRLYLTRSMVDHAADMVFMVDADDRLVYANRTACDTLALPAAGLADIPATRLGEEVWGEAQAASARFETQLSLPDRAPLDVEVTTHSIDYEAQRYRCAMMRDIGERKRTEAELHLAALVFEAGRDAIVITDADNRILTVNEAFTRITGYAPTEVIGRNPRLLKSGRQGEDFYREMWAALEQYGSWSGEVWNRRRDGSLFPEWLSITVLRDAAGRAFRYIAAGSDISERKANEARIRRLAEYDALTELPNITLLRERISAALVAARDGGTRCALLFIDLDRFKNVNDSLGHAVGDQLLCEVACRLRSTLRTRDIVGRSGGDEFVVLLGALEGPEQAAQIAQTVLAAIARPYEIDEYELRVTPSIGISVFPDDGENIDTLLKNADAAMYFAKECGRNRYQFFTRELHERAMERLSIENSLRVAIERREFELVYQAQVDARSGRLVGCEALLRWHHPERGLVSPVVFIPVAEDSGLIVPIGHWVLREACRQVRAWQAAGLAPVPVAVNVSPLQMQQPSWVESVVATLREAGVDPGLIELEVTEGALLEDSVAAIESLAAFRRMGVQLAIDDFGTGYSSLSYLRRFALDKLKIDRSFVRELPGKADDVAIVEVIIQLAKSFGLRTLAEGVETEAQRALLADRGCDAFQGYLFAKPMPAADFAALLAGRGGEPPRA